jgi:hypothetical protein
MNRGTAIACLAVMTVFCSLPHVIGLTAPTLAIPEAQLASLVCVGGAFLAFRRLSRLPGRLSFLPVYALASAATLLSSISWLGIPFVDAVFMVTGLASAITLLVQLAMLVTIAARNRGSAGSIRSGGA